METVLHTNNLTCGYGKKPILSNVALSAKCGQLIAVVGRNGSGKSTLLRTITGLLPVLSGSVCIKGNDLQTINFKKRAQLVSVVLTDSLVYGNMTIRSLIALGRYPYTGITGKLSLQDESVIDKALHEVGMEDFSDRMLSEISDGERQKAMIARALAQDTDVIVLDEPNAFLDVINRIELLYLLKKLCISTQKTIIFSSHDLQTSLTLSQELWVVNQGGVIAGKTTELVDGGIISQVFNTETISFQKESKTFTYND